MRGMGYGKGQGLKPLILLIDGHSSRWTYQGLKTLMDAGIFPFFIASHTSAWAQPNDVGLNICYKSRYSKAVKRWLLANPYDTFDRVSFNQCCAEAIAEARIDLAAELARYKAKQAAWIKCGSPEALKPKGKPGNVITRMYLRTGWWPLQKNSVLWQQSIDTLGVLCKPTKHKLTDKQLSLAELGDKSIKIRKLVLDGFQKHFLDKAHAAVEAVKARNKKKRNNISIINTVLGEGLTAEEDIAILKEVEKKKKQEAKDKQARAVEREGKKKVRLAQMKVTLHDARCILFETRNNKYRACKLLKNKHYVALLHAMGKGKLARSLKKEGLTRLYWAKHKDVTTAPGPPPPTPVIDTPAPPAPTTASTASPSVSTASPAPSVANNSSNSRWGAVRARKDANKVHESLSGSESDEGSDSDSESDEGSVFNDSYESAGEMDDGEWDKLGICEIQEENGCWRYVDILGRVGDKVRGAHVCLYFGCDEYEGLPGTYRFDCDFGLLYDSDGDSIPLRNFSSK